MFTPVVSTATLCHVSSRVLNATWTIFVSTSGSNILLPNLDPPDCRRFDLSCSPEVRAPICGSICAADVCGQRCHSVYSFAGPRRNTHCNLPAAWKQPPVAANATLAGTKRKVWQQLEYAKDDLARGERQYDRIDYLRDHTADLSSLPREGGRSWSLKRYDSGAFSKDWWVGSEHPQKTPISYGQDALSAFTTLIETATRRQLLGQL